MSEAKPTFREQADMVRSLREMAECVMLKFSNIESLESRDWVRWVLHVRNTLAAAEESLRQLDRRMMDRDDIGV